MIINNKQLFFQGTLFSAFKVKSKNYSIDYLQNEKIPLNNKIQDKLDISYKTTHPLEDSSLVAFNDPVNGKWVILSLKNDTIDKLKEYFGKDDFYQKENGIIRLTNKAEAYVAGWYVDIAYRRRFLSADKNKNGILDNDEYTYTRNDSIGNIEISNNKIIFSSDENYVHPNKGEKGVINLDEELNHTLNMDNDFNSKISLFEKEKYIAKMKHISLQQLVISQIKKSSKHNRVTEEDMIKMLLKNNSKELKALEKLRIDPNSLTQEERELVRAELEALKKKELSKEKLNETINSLKAQNKYLENMTLAMES